MKSLKHTVMGLMAAGLALTVMAGCSQKKDASSEKKVESLSIFTWNQDPAGAKREQKVYDEFTKDTGIKVKQVVAPYDKYPDKMMTMAASHTLPDLMWVYTNMLKRGKEKGIYQDLTPYLKNVDKSKWLPAALKLGQVDGKQYGLPRDMSASHVIINTDMLKQAGLKMPSDDWTMDDYLDYAKKMTIVKDGKTQVYGTDTLDENTVELAYTGTNILSADGKKVTMDSKGSIKAIQLMSDFQNKYHVSPTAASKQGVSNMFEAKKVAMELSGPWAWASLKENNIPFDIVPFPKVNDKSKQPAAWLNIAMSSQTKHSKAAFKFLKWLSQGRGQKLQMDMLACVPMIKSNVGDLAKTSTAPKNVQSLIDTLKSGNVSGGLPDTPDTNEISNTANNTITNILLKNLPVKPALTKTANEIRDKYNLK